MLTTLHFPLVQVTSQLSNVNCASSQAFRAIRRNIALNVEQVLEARKGEVHRLPVFTSRKKALVSSMGDKNKILPILIGTCVIRRCLHDRTRAFHTVATPWFLIAFTWRDTTCLWIAGVNPNCKYCVYNWHVSHRSSAYFSHEFVKNFLRILPCVSLSPEETNWHVYHS